MSDDPKATEANLPTSGAADHEVGTVILADSEPEPHGVAASAVADPLAGTATVVGPQRRGHRPALHVLLFVVTFLSAAWTQMPMPDTGSFWPTLFAALTDPVRLWQSSMFAGTLMGILLAHEMGHYLMAKRRGVDQSLPYFIPAPTLVGTLGAVILLRGRPDDRGALLEVAAVGPLVGLIPALAATIWGLAHSAVTLGPAPQTYALGSSLLFSWLRTIFGPEGAGIALHPVAFAGWVGLFVTSINLIPAAQLDGGHIAYALLGRRQTRFSGAVVIGLVALGLVSALGTGPHSGAGGVVWLLWAVLLFVIGLEHPPVRDEGRPLTRSQMLAGWLALALFIVTFVPSPISATDPGDTMDSRPQDLVLPPAPPRGGPRHRREGRWPAEEFEL